MEATVKSLCHSVLLPNYWDGGHLLILMSQMNNLKQNFNINVGHVSCFVNIGHVSYFVKNSALLRSRSGKIRPFTVDEPSLNITTPPPPKRIKTHCLLLTDKDITALV